MRRRDLRALHDPSIPAKNYAVKTWHLLAAQLCKINICSSTGIVGAIYSNAHHPSSHSEELENILRLAAAGWKQEICGTNAIRIQRGGYKSVAGISSSKYPSTTDWLYVAAPAKASAFREAVRREYSASINIRATCVARRAQQSAQTGRSGRRPPFNHAHAGKR